jgi:FkbM family methyltransferase
VGSLLILSRIPNYIKAFGILSGLVTFARVHLNFHSHNEVFSVAINGRKIWLRNTASDTSILFQIFVKREFETSEWVQGRRLRQAYEQLCNAGRTPIIVDAGANIGLAALWFGERFPEAKIFAVEPDKGNLSLLRLNIADNERIVPVAGAVWDRPSRLLIGNPEAGAGAFRVVEGEGDLRAFSVPEISAMETGGKLFIVKIDIEGSEATLFRSNTEWAEDADLIVIELHDWLYPGEGTSRNFLRRVSHLPIDFLFKGEHVFCFKTST